MLQLDRRIKRDVFAFCQLDDFYYDDLRNYKADLSCGLMDEVIAHLGIPEQWEMSQQGIWLAATPLGFAAGNAGIKIHVSCSRGNELLTLARTVPILSEAKVAFKVAIDSSIYRFSLGKNYPRSGSGKFMTIYPPEGSVRTLCESLMLATQDLEGPYILSDKRCPGSKVVFYRYGGFKAHNITNQFGESEAVYAGVNQELVQDTRAPFSGLPSHVLDPFPTEAMDADENSETILQGRYRVDGLISSSNSGGVYTGTDLLTAQKVLIKEARPFVMVTNTADALSTLRKEAEVLKRLEGSDKFPRFVDYFSEWEHEFLVEEFFSGSRLSNYRAFNSFGLLVQRLPTKEFVEQFSSRLIDIGYLVFQALEYAHARGVVLGDVSSDNILIDPDGDTIHMIDFESAFFMDDESEIPTERLTTLGYFLNGPTSALPSHLDDFQALSAVLFSTLFPTQAYFHFAPGAWDRVLREVCRDYNLPGVIETVIRLLRHGNCLEAKRAFQERWGDPHFGLTTVEVAETPQQRASLLVPKIAAHILAQVDLTRPDRIWPGDYRLYLTNPASLAFGAAGILYFLHHAQQKVEPAILSRLQILLQDGNANYIPGLFVGLDGIALPMAAAGLTEQALALSERAHHLALNTPVQSPDMFFGRAGRGVATLRLFEETGEPWLLERASALGKDLLSTAEDDDRGVFWRNVDGVVHLGFAHGSSGVALFLLQLYQHTGDEACLRAAHRSLQREMSYAVTQEDSVVFPRTETSEILSPYLRYGNAGMGSVLIRAYNITGEDSYLHMAQQAARYAMLKYTVFSGQLEGLSGIGEFLLDMFQFTGEALYHEAAGRVVDGLSLFEIPTKYGSAFPGEELMRASLDFGTGSAGAGMFLQRYLMNTPRPLLDVCSIHGAPFQGRVN